MAHGYALCIYGYQFDIRTDTTIIAKFSWPLELSACILVQSNNLHHTSFVNNVQDNSLRITVK